MVTKPHPVAGVDYPRNWHELLAWFPDDSACLRYLGDTPTTTPTGVLAIGVGRRRLVADGRRAASLPGLSV